MSEASTYVMAKRLEKREEGFRQTTVWLKVEIKNLMEEIAHGRHQDLGEMLTEAFVAWQPASAARKGTRPDPQRMRDVEKRLTLLEALVTVPASATTGQTTNGQAPLGNGTQSEQTRADTLEAIHRQTKRDEAPPVQAPEEASALRSQPNNASDQEPVLTQISQMRADGLSMQKIVDRLNAAGVSTLSGKGTWKKGTVGKLMQKHHIT